MFTSNSSTESSFCEGSVSTTFRSNFEYCAHSSTIMLANFCFSSIFLIARFSDTENIVILIIMLFCFFEMLISLFDREANDNKEGEE